MDDGNSGSLPACGEGWGGVWIPIEDVKPGDFVFSHDGQFHRVTRVLHAKYTARTITFECPDLQCKLSATEDQLVLIHRGRASFANRNQWKNVSVEQFARARELRKAMSVPEQILWKELKGKNLGVKFRRQHPIGPYIADFYARDAALVVEVDGDSHRGEIAFNHDSARDAYMLSQGLRVLRFPASDVTSNKGQILGTIYDACLERALPGSPDRQWKRAENVQPGCQFHQGMDFHLSSIDSVKHAGRNGPLFHLEAETSHFLMTELFFVQDSTVGGN
ncbi:MAG: DUF559 domain-containing protein [Candidatus Hydrogenedentes bacterium]|nr:DUF559 domain-containing protein [Candidatus Hydrogenedentota bacterium]